MWLQVDYLVVGAGFFGAVVAERLASQMGRKVLVIGRREHIGGNSYSEVYLETEIEFHRDGANFFHTTNEDVYNYFRRLTRLNNYRHQVLTRYRDRLYPMPINLETINILCGKNFSPITPQIDSQRRTTIATCYT